MDAYNGHSDKMVKTGGGGAGFELILTGVGESALRFYAIEGALDHTPLRWPSALSRPVIYHHPSPHQRSQ